MKRLPPRLPVMLVLLLFLLGAWGWMMPDHFCRLDSGCVCEIVQDCCEPDNLVSAEAEECCVEVDSYFNFPVFGHDRMANPKDFSVFLDHGTFLLCSFVYDCSCIFICEEKPPPLSFVVGSLHIPYRTFRI